MVLDTSLLNTQQYKIRIKGKVEQSRERSSALPLHLGVVAIEKGAFGSPSTPVDNASDLQFWQLNVSTPNPSGIAWNKQLESPVSKWMQIE